MPDDTLESIEEMEDSIKRVGARGKGTARVKYTRAAG